MSTDTMLNSLAPLIAAVQLHNVRLVDATATTSIRSPKDVGPVVVSLEKEARFKKRDEGTFFILATAEARVLRSGADVALVTVKATFELEYRIPEDLAVTAGQLEAFAGLNGMFNAWPYWREFIQAMTSRMGLPPLVLPVYRLKHEAASPAPVKARRRRTSEPPRKTPAAARREG
jgi:preprotein translocase subunit SecB